MNTFEKTILLVSALALVIPAAHWSAVALNGLEKEQELVRLGVRCKEGIQFDCNKLERRLNGNDEMYAPEFIKTYMGCRKGIEHEDCDALINRKQTFSLYTQHTVTKYEF